MLSPRVLSSGRCRPHQYAEVPGPGGVAAAPCAPPEADPTPGVRRERRRGGPRTSGPTGRAQDGLVRKGRDWPRGTHLSAEDRHALSGIRDTTSSTANSRTSATKSRAT